MSRTTPHCVCQNIEENNDAPSKTYSILPNYFAKLNNNDKHLPDFCLNSHSSKNKLYLSNECKVCQNYENIEHFISGTFRPHSCPTDDNDECVKAMRKESVEENPQLTNEIHKFNDKYHRKCTKSFLKSEKSKFHDQIYLMKNASATQRLDTIHQGINLYLNNGGIPLIATQETRKSQQNEFLAANNIKKPSCGLKYIIFQKLSIMTHFLTKSKDKPHSVKMCQKQLSEENLFSESQRQTKRSKSFHTMDYKDGHLCDRDDSRKSSSKLTKQKVYKSKESDTSNSSTGSIDAHAGSPITAAFSNILGGRSVPLMTNHYGNRNNTAMKDEWRSHINSPDVKEFSHKRNTHHHHHHESKHMVENAHLASPDFCMGRLNCHCPNCLYHFQHSCQQMVLDQMCRSRCIPQSPFPTPFPPCHYCCCVNHSHVFMHPSFSQSPSACCNQPPNVYCHCANNPRNCFHQFHQQNICQFDNRPRSTLCNSCQLKNTKRCQSETLDDNRHNSELLNPSRSCHQNSNANTRFKMKTESKSRNFKPSPSSHSKSVTSSIPPPPPPPPSSLYSTNDAILRKPKHRKHSHNKGGKLCDNCNVSIPQMAHSPDCTNNVQNIIYSHLNNTVGCSSAKNDQDSATHPVDGSPSCKDQYEVTPKIIKYRAAKEQTGERNEKENDKDNYPLSSSNRKGTGYGNQKEVFERRSADMFKEDPATYKPKFLSKTPETYKSKYERRHKKHQYDSNKMSKHKSLSTTREYKFIDNEDFLDSPEASSFIYHSISPMAQKNIQTVVPKKVSSFNNRQHCNYKDINFGKTELVRKAFQENMLSLREVGWYWGPLSFTEAESLMENKANGTFLVRDSGHDTYFLSLTFRVREATYHTRIEYSQGTFSFWSQPESHSATTIVEFIDKAVAHSQSGKFHYFLLTNVPGQPPMEVSLLYPLSRHQIVHSLKHMSRFVILSHVRKDHIAELSVPPALRSYLLEKQYYISNLEEFIDNTTDAHPLSYKPSTFS